MATTSLVKWVGLPKLLKKMEQTATLAESRELVHSVGGLAQTTLRNRMPSHWNRPRQVNLQETANSARVSIPRDPYIYHEDGSNYSEAGVVRSHRRKTAAQKRSGRKRLPARRGLAYTRVVIRKALTAGALNLKRQMERGWSA